jgi:hypothetical protein
MKKGLFKQQLWLKHPLVEYLLREIVEKEPLLKLQQLLEKELWLVMALETILNNDC